MCAAARCASSLSTATLAHHARASAISVSPVYGCVHVPHVSGRGAREARDVREPRVAAARAPGLRRRRDALETHEACHFFWPFSFFWRSAPFL